MARGQISTNARYMDIETIARSFVPHPSFPRLSADSHVLLLGSRGTGKTTLLFMLTYQAAAVFRKVNPDEVAVPMPKYLGIPVRAPSGILSHYTQLLSSTLRGARSEEIQRYSAVAELLYRDHVLRLALREVRDLVNRHGEILQEQGKNRAVAQAEICRHVRTALGADSEGTAFESFDVFLVRRQRRCLAVMTKNADAQGALDEDDGFPLLASLGELADALRYLGLSAGIALLADELELLPYSVRHSLLGSLRGSDDRVLLKLAANPGDLPVSELGRLTRGASVGHDYREVTLSDISRGEAIEFGQQLLDRLAQDWAVEMPFVQWLGPSLWETTGGLGAAPWRGKTPYGKSTGERAVRLEGKDGGFRRYLESKGVTAHDLSSSKKAQRAGGLRKMRAAVLVRDLFPPTKGGRRGAQGVRSLAFVTGAESVLLCLEGNPRWIRVFMNEIADKWSVNGLEIGRHIQAGALQALLQVVRARCMVVHRIMDTPIDRLGRTVDEDERIDESGEEAVSQVGVRALAMLDEVGAALQGRVFGAEFDPEPPLQFNVDEANDDRILRYLQQLAANGLVVSDARDASLDFDPRGIDFRLSFLAAANFGLPPVHTRATALSSLLSTGVTRKRRGARPRPIAAKSELASTLPLWIPAAGQEPSRPGVVGKG